MARGSLADYRPLGNIDCGQAARGGGGTSLIGARRLHPGSMQDKIDEQSQGCAAPAPGPRANAPATTRRSSNQPSEIALHTRSIDGKIKDEAMELPRRAQRLEWNLNSTLNLLTLIG
ncbi:hypothetical protein CN180_29025 [Sinorhizobium medicae]|nr:hypothetical protein CN180_29025 [Sinorhizobium medicae]